MTPNRLHAASLIMHLRGTIMSLPDFLTIDE